jgi:protein-S-isoprenylcysteine O-methyltransferase Ste14
VTYGALLGTYLLAGRWPRAQGRDVVGAVTITVLVMLVVVFAKRLSAYPNLDWLTPLGRLAWPWYVPLGTVLAVSTGIGLSYLPHHSGGPSTPRS